MKQWGVLYKKELVEMWRNYKWIWVPIVFIILGMSQPITTYYMPQILEASGVPKEAIGTIPVPTGAEVLVKTLSQYSILGLLILVLSFMGVVASERQNGSAILVFVKPVPHASYITAKWAGMISLTIVSFVLGYLATWYYTVLLIENVMLSAFFNSLWIYGLWLLLLISVVLFFSSIMKATGGIAFLSILFMAGLSVFTNLFDKFMAWSPSNLTNQANLTLVTGEVGPNFGLSVGSTVIIILGLLVTSIAIFKQKDLGE